MPLGKTVSWKKNIVSNDSKNKLSNYSSKGNNEENINTKKKGNNEKNIPLDKKPPKPLLKSESGVEEENENEKKKQFYQVKERKNYFDDDKFLNFSE